MHLNGMLLSLFEGLFHVVIVLNQQFASNRPSGVDASQLFIDERL